MHQLCTVLPLPAPPTGQVTVAPSPRCALQPVAPARGRPRPRQEHFNQKDFAETRKRESVGGKRLSTLRLFDYFRKMDPAPPYGWR